MILYEPRNQGQITTLIINIESLIFVFQRFLFRLLRGGLCRAFCCTKAIETILYIANKAPNPTFFYICKILYFADRFHLEEYGRFICGDTYIAMQNGPVPSGTYDILKAPRQGMLPFVGTPYPFDIEDRYKIAPHRNADLSIFSESDLECLDRAITDYGEMPFSELRDISHDDAWHSADENSVIPLETIAAPLEDGDAILEHLRNQ